MCKQIYFSSIAWMADFMFSNEMMLSGKLFVVGEVVKDVEIIFTCVPYCVCFLGQQSFACSNNNLVHRSFLKNNLNSLKLSYFIFR